MSRDSGQIWSLGSWLGASKVTPRNRFAALLEVRRRAASEIEVELLSLGEGQIQKGECVYPILGRAKLDRTEAKAASACISRMVILGSFLNFYAVFCSHDPHHVLRFGEFEVSVCFRCHNIGLPGVSSFPRIWGWGARRYFNELLTRHEQPLPPR